MVIHGDSWGLMVIYPLVNVSITMENHIFLWVNPLEMAILNGKVLDYQRVMGKSTTCFFYNGDVMGISISKIGDIPFQSAKLGISISKPGVAETSLPKGTLRSKTSFCVTGAGHRTIFHPCGTSVALFASCQNVGRCVSTWEVVLKFFFRGRGSIWWTWTMFWRFESLFLWNCRTVVIFDFGRDDDSGWQVRHFGCLGLIFSGRRSTLQTSTKKWLRPR